MKEMYRPAPKSDTDVRRAGDQTVPRNITHHFYILGQTSLPAIVIMNLNHNYGLDSCFSLSFS